MKSGVSHNRATLFTLITCGFLGVLGVAAFLIQLPPPRTVVSFLNVGQGDAIFIEAPNGRQVLIDAGPDGGVVRELGRVMPFWDRSIDMIIPTHADKDHIGGFPEVFERFSVDIVYDTESTASTAIYEAYASRRDDEGADIRFAYYRDTIVLDQKEHVYLRILFPDQSIADIDRNDGSTVIQLVHGDVAFMLTGDAGASIEQYLVYQYGSHLASDVLKAGHHGSRTSSSKLFLETVSPEFVVVSAGADNSYGHPHEEVVDAIHDVGAHMFETKYGMIQFVTDGTELVVVQK